MHTDHESLAPLQCGHTEPFLVLKEEEGMPIGTIQEVWMGLCMDGFGIQSPHPPHQALVRKDSVRVFQNKTSLSQISMIMRTIARWGL